MSTGRKNSRLELVVIGVFFILFSFWALSRCNNKRAEMRRQMEAGLSEAEIRATWQADLEAYREIRRKYLLYRD